MGFKLADNQTIRNGRFENTGTMKGGFINTFTYTYLAGIGVVNTQHANSEVSYVINKAGYDIEGLNVENHNKQIFYAATVIDRTVNGMTLSRAYNTENYEFSQSYFELENVPVIDEFNLNQSIYTNSPTGGIKPENTSGTLYANINKTVTNGYRFPTNANSSYLEIRELNITRNTTITVDVVRSGNNAHLNVEFLGSGQPTYTITNIANGRHKIKLTNISDENMVHTIRFTKTQRWY